MKFGGKEMRRVFVALLVAACTGVHAASRLEVPGLPQSPFDDTEISTNIAFSAGDAASRLFSIALELNATPSNTVQLAFGMDADSDGVLSWAETDFLLGWRCGGWFFRDKVTGTEAFVAREAGPRTLDWALTVGPDQVPRSLTAKEGSLDLGFAASRGMFSPSWNRVRVTLRGLPGPIYAANGGVFAPGFAIRLR